MANTAPSLEILGQNYYSGMPFKTLFKCLQRQDPEDFFDVEDFMITRIIPVEIMEFVFVELSIKDIRSCLRTCIRWNHIIHAMFKNKSKSTHSARMDLNKTYLSKGTFNNYVAQILINFDPHPLE